jgi:hypothetical protein
VVTSDNPRSEDPVEIANAVMRGVRDAGHRRWSIEVDRHAAIAQAIASAKASDIVLVAGKGHETYQESTARRTRSPTRARPMQRSRHGTPHDGYRDRRPCRCRPRRRRQRSLHRA